MQNTKKQNGITLIALVITIIVMMILVGVSVTAALNGGLFSTAQKAARDTEAEKQNELALSDGKVQIGDLWYNSIEEYTNGGTGTGIEYTIGTEVTIGETGENFYVIKDKGAKLVLLAKKCINTTSLKQENDADEIVFARGESYWSTYEGTYPLDLNKYGECTPGSAMDIAKQYAEKITGSRDNGRLMTLEELEELGGVRGESTTEACNTNGNDFVNSVDGSSLDYWLGSASAAYYVLSVYGGASNLSGQFAIGYEDFDPGPSLGVRPVIEISQSSVERVATDVTVGPGPVSTEGWSENVRAVTIGTHIIPLPNGFEISEDANERTVEGGLVIKDGLNEFVWVPVPNYASYTDSSFGPLTGTDDSSSYVYDSQEELNYYYGMQEDDTTPYYNYSEFTYADDKGKVEENIKKYGGFYVGRYETTINGTTIGVQQGKTVLTTDTVLKEGTNTGEGMSGEPFYYRWWGLYKAQKDMYKNHASVGSLMISDEQYGAVQTFTEYGNKSNNINGIKFSNLVEDVLEFTLAAESVSYSKYRRLPGYYYLGGEGGSTPMYGVYGPVPSIISFSTRIGSRVALYIK